VVWGSARPLAYSPAGQIFRSASSGGTPGTRGARSNADERSRTFGYTQNGVYLAPANNIDSDHPAIEAFVARTVTLAMSPAEKGAAVLIWRHARPATIPTSIIPILRFYRASSVLTAGGGYCVGKAALFAALCRAAGVPARVALRT